MRCPVCHRRLRPKASCPRHPEARAGESDAPEPAPEAPPEIPGCSGLVLLGGGGFASVWAGRRDADGAEVAVKLAHAPGDARFPRERAALLRVGPPTAPALLAEGAAAGNRPYLVLERLRGETLADRLAGLPDAGALPLRDALPVVRALCEAVDRVHLAGVVHRDLKPQNVFLRDDGSLALLDFGMARGAGAGDDVTAAAPDLTRTGQRLGTVAYMSPEQCLEARDVDARTDVYALGVIVFELLCGRPPYVGDAAQVLQAHVARRPPRPSELAPLPIGVDEVVARCLAKDRGQRFDTAGDVAAALARVAADASARAPAAPAAPAEPARPTSARRPVALLALRTSAPADQVVAAISGDGGQVVRAQADQLLCGFPGEAAPAAGVRAALRAAQRLAGAVAPLEAIVVHVAEVRAREGARGVVLAGTAVERPDGWLPAPEARAAARGVLCTAAAAALLEGGVAAPAAEDGFATITPAPRAPALSAVATATPPLLGRDELVAALLAEARAAIAGDATPTLTTVVGEVGHGKSRVLAAVQAELAAGGARVLALAPPPPEAGAADALLGDLLRAGLALPDGPASAEDVRRACHERLGDAEGEALFPAVALTLDALPESAPRVAAVLAAPGALRHAQVRAAGRALRRAAAAAPLALLVDDAHRADQASLDALELATLGGDAAPIWVCVAARPALEAMRPLWADRAGRRHEHELGPLAPAAAGALARELLRPVEFVPEPVVARLVELTQGVPLYLVELAHALRSGGAIRQHRGTKEWYVAADELPHLSAAGLADALADRAAAGLSPQLVSLARICAVLGEELSVAEVDAVQLAVATPEDSMDPGVGLGRLARAGILRPRGAGYAFRHPLLRDAVAARTPPALRARLHRAALAELRRTADPAHPPHGRIARHAAACGERELAFDASFALAEEARRRHRYVEADQHYTAALAQLEERDGDRRERALDGRGRARYRLQRFQDALDDLEAARRLAEARGDEAAVCDRLLEEATVLDWSYGWAESARRAERAAAMAERVFDPLRSARCALAAARVLWREDRADEAIARLAAAAEAATVHGDHETRTIALLLMGPALVSLGRLDEAAARFEEVIALCEEAGDSFHLCAAVNNRLYLWIKRQMFDAAAADQRRAIALARELGFAVIERGTTFNLAELLYYLGRSEEALPLARRAHALRDRLGLAVPDDALLLARIVCSLGQHEEAAVHLDWIRGACSAELPPIIAALADLVALQVAAAGGVADVNAWTQVVARASGCAVLDEYVEVLYVAGRTAAALGWRDQGERWLRSAREQAVGSPVWKERLQAVSSETTNPDAIVSSETTRRS